MQSQESNFIDLSTEEKWRLYVDAAVRELGLSWDDLRRQAAEGHFSSGRARSAWMTLNYLDPKSST
jgi:hypothetical protein